MIVWKVGVNYAESDQVLKPLAIIRGPLGPQVALKERPRKLMRFSRNSALSSQGLKPLAILCGPFGAAGRSSGATKKAMEVLC
jgi:hypothetical protein